MSWAQRYETLAKPAGMQGQEPKLKGGRMEAIAFAFFFFIADNLRVEVSVKRRAHTQNPQNETETLNGGKRITATERGPSLSIILIDTIVFFTETGLVRFYQPLIFF